MSWSRFEAMPPFRVYGNLVCLLNLAEPAQSMLMAGAIDMGHARALLTLDRGMQVTAANQIAARKMSVREAEALVKRLGVEFALTPSRRSNNEATRSSDLKHAEEEVADLLMSAVDIRARCELTTDNSFSSILMTRSDIMITSTPLTL